jgi:hypothetical protein
VLDWPRKRAPSPIRNPRALSDSAPACYDERMESFGERITRIIIDLEMKRAGVIYIDTLEDRLADYHDGPEQDRFLADARVEGFRVKPYRKHAPSVAARH